MILMLAIFVLVQDPPSSNAAIFLISLGGIIIAAIISGVMAVFQTQANRRYKEFKALEKQQVKNTSDIRDNTTHDKNRSDKFKEHENRMKEAEKSIKDFLTEYKKEAKGDWKDFKKEVKGDFEGFKTDIKKEISDLRKEIHDNK